VSQHQQFEARVRRAGPTVTVELVGELDIATADTLRRVLLDLVVAQAERTVVLDLSELEFVDSTGLSVFIDAHKRLVSEGGSLRLYGPRPGVSKVMSITGVSQLIPVDGTANEVTQAS